MSQDGVERHLAHTHTHTHALVLVYTWWGSTRYGASAPPADPQLSILHIPPRPPLRPLFKVRQRGKGGQGRLCTPHVAGRSAGQPSLAQTQKTIVMMVKGPWSLGPRAPSIHFLLMHAQVHASKNNRRSAKPRRRSRRSIRPRYGGKG